MIMPYLLAAFEYSRATDVRINAGWIYPRGRFM